MVKKDDILEALGFDTGTNWFPIALAGFGVGCLVGTAVAMLVAPKAGRELRSDIMQKGRDIKEILAPYAGNESKSAARSGR